MRLNLKANLLVVGKIPLFHRNQTRTIIPLLLSMTLEKQETFPVMKPVSIPSLIRSRITRLGFPTMTNTSSCRRFLQSR